jgi:transcriptional regulator with XRE-family HTH domain
MKPQDLRDARLEKGWSQTEAAARLSVSQAYVNMLEKGKRRLTSKLTRRFAQVYGLSPEVLPVSETFDRNADPQYLTESLAKLGYPGFAHLRTHVAKKNPGEVLLSALKQDSLDARVAEALPWVPLHYWHMDSTWLLEQARKLNLQNRLGFVVSLARQVSERDRENDQRTRALRELETKLDESRLAKEDVFYRPPRTPGEKEWLLQNRPEAAKHWNLMADLRPEHLQYAR